MHTLHWPGRSCAKWQWWTVATWYLHMKGTVQEIKSMSGSKAGYSIWAVNHTIIMTLRKQVFPDDIILLSHHSSPQNENSVYSFTHPGFKETGPETMSKDGKLQIQDIHPSPAKCLPLRQMGMLLDSFVRYHTPSLVYRAWAFFKTSFIYLILPLIASHIYSRLSIF